MLTGDKQAVNGGSCSERNSMASSPVYCSCHVDLTCLRVLCPVSSETVSDDASRESEGRAGGEGARRVLPRKPPVHPVPACASEQDGHCEKPGPCRGQSGHG